MTRTFAAWFDNIFGDMAVRSRIHASHRVVTALTQVERAPAALEQKGRDPQEVAALDRRREELVRG